MPTDERVVRRSPNIPNRDKSVHERGSGNAPYVRIRHPETHRIAADAQPCDCGGTPNELGGETTDVDHKCEQFADTYCYPIDNFTRIVQQPAITPSGAPWSGSINTAMHRVGDACNDFDTGFSFNPTGWWDQYVYSTIGGSNRGWTDPCNDCGGLSFQFYGWSEKEIWYSYTVPARPADTAGAKVVVNSQNWSSAGPAPMNGLNIVVASTPPTGLRHGTSIGVAFDGATTAFIPNALIPAEGSTLYIGLTPNWMAFHGSFVCGWNYPDRTGQGNSGKYAVGSGVNAAAVTWQVWTGLTSNFGSVIPADESGAWWDSSLSWTVGGTGAEFASITGHAVKFDVAAGSTESLTLRLDGFFHPDDSDTDEQYENPWDHENGIRLKMRFKVVTAGSTSEAGSRYLSLSFADGYDVYKATVYLGDTGHAEGVEVTMEDGSDYVAKPFTNGEWCWLTIDTRHPNYVRAKLWTEDGELASGEPARYDVQMVRSDEAETPLRQNFLEIAMSAGNMTGANQVIYIDRLLACGPADKDCQWVEEKIGEGDGQIAEFQTSMPFKTGSLWFFVDGFHVRTRILDKDDGTFEAVQRYPAANHATLVTRYLYEARPGE